MSGRPNASGVVGLRMRMRMRPSSQYIPQPGAMGGSTEDAPP